MSSDEPTLSPDEFRGLARLFPLPNLVLFPGISQLLHVFEPRYRQMVDEALAGDGLIAMAVLAPGWEADYEGRPTVLPVACLGRVATHRREADGRYYLLLEGLARIRIDEELPPDKLFRRARAALLADEYPPGGESRRAELQRRVMEALRGVLPELPEVREPFEQLFRQPMNLGKLTDLAAYTLDLDVAQKAELLAELDVDRRAHRLLDWLAPDDRPSALRYPPDFSTN